MTLEHSTLQEAHRLVYGPRGELYAHPHDDYNRTVQIFELLTGIKMTAADGLLFMTAVKLSRLGHAHINNFTPEKKQDTIVDTEGYLDCYWQEITWKEPQCKQPNESPMQYAMLNGELIPSTDLSVQPFKDMQQSGSQPAQPSTDSSHGNQSKAQQ